MGPSLVAGIGLALSLPPWGFWVLAFPAAGLLWWRLGGLRLRARILAGWATGLGLFVPGLWWATTFNTYGGAVLMVLEALAPALACAAVPRGDRGRAAVLAGAMVLVEALRATWPFGGLPMGGVALGQAGGPLAGAARLGGPLLLVGLVWLGGSGLALVVAPVRLALDRYRWARGAGAGPRAAGEAGTGEAGAGGRAEGGADVPIAAGAGSRGAAGVPAAAGTGAGGADPPEPGWWGSVPDAARRPRPLRHDVRTGTTFTAGPSPLPPPARGAGALVAAALSLVAVVGLSSWGAAAPDGGPPVRLLRVAAVQGGGVRGHRQSEVDPTAVYEAQFAATAEIASRDRGRPPSLVLWPEDVVALDGPLDGSPEETRLSALAVDLRATLVVGVTETVPGLQFRNEAVAFSPTGQLVARFEKVHRVPFGEYVPYRGFFKHLADLSGVPLDAVPGHGVGVLHTPAGPLGALISYEVFYADRGRTTTRAGAQLLVDPTNTSSYKTSQVPTQEIAAARLQAISEGRDLVQAAPTGFSAVIDHRGRVVLRSTLAARTVIVGDVAMRVGRTLYERGGDLPVLLAAAGLVVGGWTAAATGGPGSPRARRDGRARRRRP